MQNVLFCKLVVIECQITISLLQQILHVILMLLKTRIFWLMNFFRSIAIYVILLLVHLPGLTSFIVFCFNRNTLTLVRAFVVHDGHCWSMHHQCGTHTLLKASSESNPFRDNSLNGSLAETTITMSKRMKILLYCQGQNVCRGLWFLAI